MTIPEGHLPVFSCDTEEQAKALIIAACGTNYRGEYIAKELAAEQTLDTSKRSVIVSLSTGS